VIAASLTAKVLMPSALAASSFSRIATRYAPKRLFSAARTVTKDKATKVSTIQ